MMARSQLPRSGGRPLRIIKNQLVRDNTRFDEIDILEAIHKPKPIPGVVHVACYEISDTPLEGRTQVRLGLEQQGQPFMSIKTSREMLMAAYDALESKFGVSLLSIHVQLKLVYQSLVSSIVSARYFTAT
jgi:hypothetical protein